MKQCQDSENYLNSGFQGKCQRRFRHGIFLNDQRLAGDDRMEVMRIHGSVSKMVVHPLLCFFKDIDQSLDRIQTTTQTTPLIAASFRT
jgi:hypothetical protein